RGATSAAQRPLPQPASKPTALRGRLSQGKSAKYSPNLRRTSAVETPLWSKRCHSRPKSSTVARSRLSRLLFIAASFARTLPSGLRALDFGIASIVLAEVSERLLAASPSHSVAATNLELGACVSWRLRAPSVPVPHRPR